MPSPATPFDLAAVRADTPGCEQVAHFNNAGASLSPRQVNETLIAHLRREELLGGYEAAAAAADQLAQVYRSAASLIGARSTEIAIVESASRAWDIVFYGFRLTAGDRILVDRARYPGHAVAMIQLADTRGVAIDVVENDESGQLDVADLERKLTADVKLVALTHVPTDSGLINPIPAAGKICQAAGVPLLVDSCQSVGQLAVDVDELGCDMLTATARKFVRGPRGTGFLYVRSKWLEAIEPLTLDVFASSWDTADGYSLLPDARRFESFERSFAGVLGLGAALDYAQQIGSATIETRVRQLAKALRERLSQIDGVTLDLPGVDLCGIVTFTVGGHDSAAVYGSLVAQHINTSVTRPQPGAVALGLTPSRPRVRASVHYYNSENEIDTLVRAIEQMSVKG